MPREPHTTREGYLVEAMALLDKEFFAGRGYTLPAKLRVSCGFPKGASSKAIGQCWDPKVAVDGTTHMFISPALGEEIVSVLATLLHEMIHAQVGLEEKHKGAFRKLAKEFGLAGKMTATYAEQGSELHHKLSMISAQLGPYPHAPMRPLKKTKPAASGWVRLMSKNEEGYRLVISPKMIEEFGYPQDPWGDEMFPVEG